MLPVLPVKPKLIRLNALLQERMRLPQLRLSIALVRHCPTCKSCSLMCMGSCEHGMAVIDAVISTPVSLDVFGANESGLTSSELLPGFDSAMHAACIAVRARCGGFPDDLDCVSALAQHLKNRGQPAVRFLPRPWVEILDVLPTAIVLSSCASGPFDQTPEA